MNETRNPELHTNEDPRNDFLDVAMGFGGFFIFLLLIAVLATAIQAAL